MASKFVGVGFGKALVRSLPIYVVFLATIAFAIFFPTVVLWLPKHLIPESVGLLQESERRRLHLPAVNAASPVPPSPWMPSPRKRRSLSAR